MFVEGSNILVSLGMAFFHTHEKELMKLEDLMDTLVSAGGLVRA